jgi:hypothetical protein
MWSYLVESPRRLHCQNYSIMSYLGIPVQRHVLFEQFECQQWYSQFVKTVVTIDISPLLANSKLVLSSLGMFKLFTTVFRQDGNQKNIQDRNIMTFWNKIPVCEYCTKRATVSSALLYQARNCIKRATVPSAQLYQARYCIKRATVPSVLLYQAC